jgi:hypothetical protein
LLDLDYIRAVVRKDLSAEWSSEDARKVKDAEASERKCVVTREGRFGADMAVGGGYSMALAAKSSA